MTVAVQLLPLFRVTLVYSLPFCFRIIVRLCGRIPSWSSPSSQTLRTVLVSLIMSSLISRTPPSVIVPEEVTVPSVAIVKVVSAAIAYP